jgi:transcriptional regulator with XRE-family HTH domain
MDGVMDKTDVNAFFKGLGERIAAYRKDQNLTQAEIAGKLGVTQQLIAYYEKGIRRLPLWTLFRIAEILQADPNDLLGFKTNKQKPGPAPKILKTLEQINKLPLTKQKMVFEFLNNFIQNNTKKAP